MPRAWVLNFDAEDELSHPGATAVSPKLRPRFDALAARVSGLFGDGDVRLDEFEVTSCRGHVGRAWCPTPRALRAMARAGVTVPEAPTADVLRAVNHRRFSAELGQWLPGARYVDTRDALDAALRGGSVSGRWILKRAWSYNGRGRLRVSGHVADAHASAWIDAALARGAGVQVEPEVDRTLDVGLHGFLARDGALTWGELTVQHTDAQGQWIETVPAPWETLDAREVVSLREAAGAVADALRTRGYFGPFGIDGFRWDGGFVPCCDVNARYSMGWPAGMGARRPDLAV